MGTRTKILDFGIARLTDLDEAITETALTLTGLGAIGTAAYTSPEQAVPAPTIVRICSASASCSTRC
jgi:hypothetical protein